MTQREIERIVRVWQRRLGLSHWNITVDFSKTAADYCGRDNDDDAPTAGMWRAKSYDEATIYLNAEWRSWTERDAKLQLVHELLHAVTRDIEFVLNMLDGNLHRDVQDAVEATFSHHVEGFVDRLAHRLVELEEELTAAARFRRNRRVPARSRARR